MCPESGAIRFFEKHSSCLRPLRVIAVVSLCAGGLALTGGFGRADDGTGGLRGIGRDSSRQSSYAIGDKLKITVFEQIGPQLSGRYLGASAVERTELSGEYTVQEDGNIYIPLVGPVAVAGELFQELEDAIGASLGARLDGSVKIGIQLLDREPIYVAGADIKTGPYKHIPGMRVLHALILTGAFETSAGDQWRILGLGPRERAPAEIDRAPFEADGADRIAQGGTRRTGAPSYASASGRGGRKGTFR